MSDAFNTICYGGSPVYVADAPEPGWYETNLDAFGFWILINITHWDSQLRLSDHDDYNDCWYAPDDLFDGPWSP